MKMARQDLRVSLSTDGKDVANCPSQPCHTSRRCSPRRRKKCCLFSNVRSPLMLSQKFPYLSTMPFPQYSQYGYGTRSSFDMGHMHHGIHTVRTQALWQHGNLISQQSCEKVMSRTTQLMIDRKPPLRLHPFSNRRQRRLRIMRKGPASVGRAGEMG